MNIAIDVRPITHWHRSGIFTYTEKLIRSLAEIDSENNYLLLFTSLRKKADKMPGPVKSNFSKKVLTIPDREFPYKDFLLYDVFLPRALSDAGCDVYHNTIGDNLPKNSKAKKVLTIHDLVSIKNIDKTFKQNLQVLRQAAERADTCIAISETTKQDMVDGLKIKPEKIKVVYEGVDERFEPIKNEAKLNAIKKKYGIEKKYFFSIGQVPRKNIERLIKAFAIFKYKDDFQLVIGGAGSGGPWDVKYRALASSLGIEKQVNFIGYIPDEDLPQLYNASECFAFPSLYEGFGLPILEAMRCGTPVIASNVSSLPEIGADAILYIDPYSEYEIAKVMEKVVGNAGLKDELIGKGINRANDFSWQKMAEETLRVYLQLS